MWHFERREYCGVGPWEQGAADRWTAPSRSLNIKRLLVIQKPFCMGLPIIVSYIVQ